MRRNLDPRTRGNGGFAAQSVRFPTRHRRAELAAGLHSDLLVGAPEVPFDRLERHEQRLRDLPVRHSLGGEPCDLALSRGQGVDTGGGLAAGPPARRHQLLSSPRDERPRAAAVSEVEPPPERFAGVEGLAGAPQRGAQVDGGPRPPERGLGALQHPNGLLSDLHRGGALRQRGDAAERLADCARRPEARRERELLFDQGVRLLAISKLNGGGSRERPPRIYGGVAPAKPRLQAAGLEEIVESLPRPHLRERQAAARCDELVRPRIGPAGLLRMRVEGATGGLPVAALDVALHERAGRRRRRQAPASAPRGECAARVRGGVVDSPAPQYGDGAKVAGGREAEDGPAAAGGPDRGGGSPVRGAGVLGQGGGPYGHVVEK